MAHGIIDIFLVWLLMFLFSGLQAYMYVLNTTHIRLVRKYATTQGRNVNSHSWIQPIQNQYVKCYIRLNGTILTNLKDLVQLRNK